jgi:N-methylhydantoinase B
MMQTAEPLETSVETSIDAVTLGILWDRLISITDEGVSVMLRSSFSTILRECLDLTAILFDADGNAIAQGTKSLPSFTGTGPATLRHILERYPPETLNPGDVLATNDAWQGTGHYFDICVMRPAFRDGRIVGYTMSISHLPDIGGIGYTAAATDIYQEGLRIPVCKLLEGGRPNELVFEIIRANVRVSEQVVGDIMANVSCNQVSGQKLVEFMDEYGLDDLGDLSLAIRRQSERSMRECIRDIPDGVYRNTIDIEGFDESVTLACSITVAGDDLIIDYEGTGPSVSRGINCALNITSAWTYFALKCLMAGDIPNNQGFLAPVSITAPEGCILNARPPSPTAGRHLVVHFIPSLIFGAFAEAIPDVAQAESGMIGHLTVQGRHRNGREISDIFTATGGVGGTLAADGAETTSTPTTIGVVPVEIWESLTSMTIESKSFIPDSGGVGRTRGGLGQEVVLRNDSDNTLTVFPMGYRTDFPAKGYHGGTNGQPTSFEANGTPLHPKDRHLMAPGDRVRIKEAGGGGFGAVGERDPERVLADVLEGYVSVECARDAYGVEVDVTARTARRRP